MPHIVEHSDCYEYTNASGVPVRFPKADPPNFSGPGLKPSEILASIRAADPEAATIVWYQPSVVSIPALRLTLAKLGHMNRIREELSTLAQFDREMFENGQTCSTSGSLCMALRGMAKMDEAQWRSVLVLAEDFEKYGLSDQGAEVPL